MSVQREVRLRQFLGTVKVADGSGRWVKDSQLLYQALFYTGSEFVLRSLFYSSEWGLRPYRSVLSYFSRVLPRSAPTQDYSTWKEAEKDFRTMSAFFQLRAEFCTPNFTAVTGHPTVREHTTYKLTVLFALRALSMDQRRPPAVTQLPAFRAENPFGEMKSAGLQQSDLLYQAVMTYGEEYTCLHSVYHSEAWREEPYRYVVEIVDGSVSSPVSPVRHAHWSGVEHDLRLGLALQYLESEWCSPRFKEVTNREFSFKDMQFKVLDIPTGTSTELEPMKKRVQRDRPPTKVPKPAVPTKRVKPPINDLPYLYGTKRRRPWGRSHGVHTYEDKYIVYQVLLARKADPSRFYLASVYYDVSGLIGPFYLVVGWFTTRRTPTFNPGAEAENWEEIYKRMTSYFDKRNYTVVDEWYSEDVLSWWHPSGDHRVQRSSGRRYVILSF